MKLGDLKLSDKMRKRLEGGTLAAGAILVLAILEYDDLISRRGRWGRR